MVFLRGHRIRLEGSSSNFPRFDRDPNTGTVIASETNVATEKQSVMHSKEYPSHLVLPIIPALKTNRGLHLHFKVSLSRLLINQ